MTTNTPRIWFIHLRMEQYQADEAILMMGETIVLTAQMFTCDRVTSVKKAAEQMAAELNVPLCWTFVDEDIYAEKVGAGSAADLYEMPGGCDEFLHWIGEKVGYEELVYSPLLGYSYALNQEDDLEEEEEVVEISLEDISTTELLEELRLRHDVLYQSILTEDDIVAALERHDYATSDANIVRVYTRLRELLGADHTLVGDMLTAAITGASHGTLERDEPTPIPAKASIFSFFTRKVS